MEIAADENQMQNFQEQNHSNSNCLINISNLIKVKGYEATDYGQLTIYQDPIKSQLIAVKTLFKSSVTDFNYFKQLKHKCIAPVIGFNKNPPQIATIYSSQGSLKDLMIERQIGKDNILSNPSTVAKIIVGIARGMCLLHFNWNHYDLKPSNILIDEDGNPIITDYFNHKEDCLDDLKNQFSSKSDTKFYLPPEVININSKNLNEPKLKAIDSYSFAIILYELLFNKPVFPKNISSELFLQQIENYTLNIPDTIHPVVKEIIKKCLSKCNYDRLSFNDIFHKLRQIDFKITPNVEPEIVKSYINSLSKQTEVNIRLWDGQLMPILISNDDSLFDIRQKIAERANMNFHDVILSRNKKPLYCCWNCNDKNLGTFEALLKKMEHRDEFLANPVIELVIRILAVAEDYPKFEDTSFQHRSIFYPVKFKTYEKNETSFFMIPGTIQNLIDNIVCQKRNLWMLNNYNLKIRYKNYVRHPFESMLDDGITNCAKVIVDVNWNTWVEVNHSVVRCNLDDPVDELICRYVMMNDIKIDGIPCLSNNHVNVNLNSSFTIRDCGIKEMDNLSFHCTQTDYFVLIKGNRICCDPKHSIRTLKLMWILVTKKWKPIGNVYSVNDDDDKSIESFGILNGSRFDLSESQLLPAFYGNLQY